ncbi:MAG: WYL domain-containing protein [Candidatus Cloacimonetes bacterium]|nr:WYL domain-containing protein [Candidatus Cloacimonadota bacterium]
MQTFIAFDIESTGLNPFYDRLIELAAIRFELDPVGGNCRETGVFQRLINPTIPIPEQASKVHRIYDADVSDKPVAKDVLPEFLDFIGKDSILVAHNAQFDTEFIGAELFMAGIDWPPNPVWDTLSMSRALIPNIMNHKLETLVHHFALPVRDFHRAEDDSRYLVLLFAKFLKLAGGLDFLSKHASVTYARSVKALLDVRLSLSQAPINQAIRSKKALSFVYEEMGQNRNVRFRPLFLFKSDKYNWISGTDLDHNGPKCYRLDRISGARCENL